jgi:hypothetical protein
MNSPYRMGLLAAVGALVVGGSVFAVSALGSPPPPQLPSDSPVTLQTRSNDDGSFTAPPSSDPGEQSTSIEPPAQDPAPAPADPLTTQVEPPIETYTAPPPPYDDDDDSGDDHEDDDDSDDDD